MDTNCIWVAVTIGKDDPEYFSLKRFNDESKPFKFAKMLREYQKAATVEVEFDSQAENMPKYLNRIGIDGEIKNLFFGKSCKNKILFKGSKVFFHQNDIKNFNLLFR